MLLPMPRVFGCGSLFFKKGLPYPYFFSIGLVMIQGLETKMRSLLCSSYRTAWGWGTHLTFVTIVQ